MDSDQTAHELISVEVSPEAKAVCRCGATFDGYGGRGAINKLNDHIDREMATETIPEFAPEERAREVRRILIQTVGELGQGLKVLSAEYRGGQWLSMAGTIQQLWQLVIMQDELMKELPRG